MLLTIVQRLKRLRTISRQERRRLPEVTLMPKDDSSASLALSEAILSHVNAAQGIKATQLAADVIIAIGGQAVDVDFVETLDQLIQDGEIVEIEYVLADMDYLVKSFLLPKGAKIRKLRGGDCVFMFTPDGNPSHTTNAKSPK